MEDALRARSLIRRFALAAAILVTASCAANPKSVKSSTEVIDGQAAAAAPAPEPAAPAATPGCSADSECKAGERCDAGRCVAAPAEAEEACSLVRVQFAFDSAQLDETAMGHLRENAECLSKRGATALLVEGHCDERGTTEYNIALGARRANAVKRYLADLGVTGKIESVSFGKEIPLVDGSDESAWAQNRRSELRLPGEKRSDGKLVAGR